MKVYVFHPAFGEPSGSPFSVKAMCLLEMSGKDWAPEYIRDPRKMPKAKLPVLEDGGKMIADSDQIRDHLEQAHGVDFDAGLSDEQKAVSRALIRMAEEDIYFAVLCDRWMNDANWLRVKDAFFSHLTFPMSLILPPLVRKGVLAQVNGQGMGRHSEEERLGRIDADIASITTLLGDKPFLFGDTPTAADASVAPMLKAFAVSPVETRLSARVRGDEPLMAYLTRAKERIYPDGAKATP